ncbi:hypothetical protein Tco_0795947 [Tanacetum coccineum]
MPADDLMFTTINVIIRNERHSFYGTIIPAELTKQTSATLIIQSSSQEVLSSKACGKTFQLGVESYQKKLNLTKPDTYRSNLRRRDAYTPYSDPKGFIYENKDKKNILMRIDELHKFSDGTLDDVRTALNDRLKVNRMEYLTQTFSEQRDKVDPYGFEGYLKMEVETSATLIPDEVLKLKNFKKDATLKLSKSTNQERYEHVGPEVASPQDGKVTRCVKEIGLVDDSQRCSRFNCQTQVQRNKPSRINDHDNILTGGNAKRRLPKKQTPTVDLEQDSEKSPSEILKIKKEQAKKQKIPKFNIKSTDKAILKEFDQKSALYRTMHANTNEALRLNPFASAKEPVEEPTAEVVMDDADILLGPAYNLLKGTCSSSVELEYHFQECFNALTDRLDWNNPEGDRYPFDLSKPLPLQGHPGHLTVAADYFFNNDLEYLKSSDPERTYTTSITKRKAARYKIKGIEDLVLTLWRVKSFSVKKLHGYGHLEEIVVKRANRQFYKFKEGDFVDLHLNDIEDMLLLAVQHKLFHLTDSDIVDFMVPLRMFTRSLVIKKRVEDL